jgi:hypothetical protein
MKGRPILGAISGLLFGTFLMFDLIFLKVVESDVMALWALPVIFLILGLVLARGGPRQRPPK